MLLAGTCRTNINPFPGVELTGWGYYIERRWQTVHDDLQATALAVENNGHGAVLVALDLMVIDIRFTNVTRQRICEATGLPPSAVMLTCSHSHNAPAAGGLLGVGQCDRRYEDFASERAAQAAIAAWNSRQQSYITCGHTQVDGLTFNRTRPNGLTDTTLTSATIHNCDGVVTTVLVNFGAHPTVYTHLRPHAVSRDIPGRVCDLLEQRYPGATAIYIQGACGDVNFHRNFQSPEQSDIPATRLSDAAVENLTGAISTEHIVRAHHDIVALPTRRWLRSEIDSDLNEASRRLASDDFCNWRETIGRSMTNRPDDMVARHQGNERRAVQAMCRFHLEWSELMLKDFAERPEFIDTEVQALRIGPLTIVANASEFFSPFAIDVRQRSESDYLMIACYSNGRIGYLPDAYDINAKTYAGYQSPKYCNQFPFTAESGPAMCDAMCRAIETVATAEPDSKS